MKHEEYEKHISGKCAEQKKVVEDVNSERILPIAQSIRYALQPEKEHNTKKIERCANDLSQSCITSGKHGYRVTNSLSVLIWPIPNSVEPQHRPDCREHAINEYPTKNHNKTAIQC
jgi:hypothetical protein